MSRLVRPAGEALGRRASDPGSPAAYAVFGGLLGDADRAAVLASTQSAAHARRARFRELTALVRGLGPLSAHRDEGAWVVAVRRARADR
jgi:hypothetical protein